MGEPEPKNGKKKRSVPVRLLRLVARLVLWSVGLAVAAAVTLLLVLQTEWGRERLRRIVVDAANQALDGTLAIDHISVGLDGKVEVDGIKLTSHGVDVVRARKVQLEWLWLPLLVKHVNVTYASVEGLELAEPVGPLVKPQPEKQGGGASLELSVARLDVGGWSFTGRGGLRIEGNTTLSLGAKLDGDKPPGVEVVLRPSQVRAEGETISLSGKVALAGSRAELNGFKAEASGGASLAVPSASYDLVTGRLDATVDVQVAAAAIARRLPKLAWLGDVKAGLYVARTSAAAPLEAHLGGTAAGARFALSARVPASGSPITGTLQITGFSPGVVDRRLPRGRVTGTVSVKDLRPATLEGKVDVLVVGALGKARIDTVSLKASREGDRARAVLVLRTDRGNADVTVVARVPAGGKGIVIDDAHVRGAVPDVAAVAGDYVPISGGAHDVDVAVTGALDDLKVVGSAQLDQPAMGTTGAASVALAVDLAGLPARVRGKAHLDALTVGDLDHPEGAVRHVVADAVIADGGRTVDLELDGEGIGPVDRAHVTGRLSLGRSTKVALADVRVQTKDVVWAGHGGDVEIDAAGGISVRTIAVTSPVGSIVASGRLDPPHRKQTRGKHQEEGTLELQLGGVDIAGLERLGAPDRVKDWPLTGTIDLSARLVRHERELQVTVKGGVKRFSWREGMPPLDLDAEVQVAGGRLSGGATVSDGVGTLVLGVDTKAPIDPLDAKGWRAVDADDVHSAKLALSHIDLARVAELASKPGIGGGVVDGTITLPAHGGQIDELDLELGAKGLTRPGWTAPFDATLTGGWKAATSTFSFRLGALTGGKEVAKLEGGLVVGIRDLWRRGGEAVLDARGRVELALVHMPLDVFQQLGLVKLRRLEGTVDASLVLDGQVRDPKAKVTAKLADVRARGARMKIVTLDAEADLRSASGRLRAAGEDGKQDVNASVSVSKRPDGEIALDVTAQLRALDLGFLRTFARDDVSPLSSASGTLDAEMWLTGTLSRPTGKIAATLVDGRFLMGDDIERIDKAVLEAGIDAGTITLGRLEAQAGKGSLAGHGTIRLTEPSSLEVELATRRFSFLAGANIVEVTTQTHIQGGREDATRWEATATLRGTTIALPRARAQALQSLGALEDVHFVDSLATERAESDSRKARAAPAPEQTTHLHIETPEEVHIISPEADATVVADHLIAEMANGRVAIFGDVDVTGGKVVVEGRDWDIRKAHASFDGSFPLDAAIDVLIAHDFEAATVNVGLSGTLRHPELALSATPAIYDEQQLLSIVAGGEPDDQGLASASVGGVAAGIGANLVLGPVKKAIREVIPIDVLRVTVENSGEGGDWQFGGEVGFHVTKSLLLMLHYRGQQTVTTNLENTLEMTFQWNLLRNWLLEGRFGDQNIGGLDLLWSFRK